VRYSVGIFTFRGETTTLLQYC